jgi:DNA-binding winged helix-turn-helix (wHTH) protein/TolB-like protein
MSVVNESSDAWSERATHVYEFGPFVLDKSRRLLLKESKPVTLSPKTYDTLVVLVESRGRFLSKEELMGSLWPDSFVEESNLTQQISMLRKALGESAGEDRYVITVPGRGYRFVAYVSLSLSKTANGHGPLAMPRRGSAAIKIPDDRPERRKIKGAKVVPLSRIGVRGYKMPESWSRFLQRRTAVLIFLIIFIIIFISGTVYWLTQPRSARAKLTHHPRTIAILPFRNLKHDAENDFLGFSLADAVITKLNYISALTVRPSSSVERYRDQPIDPKQVSMELNVDTLLTGSFIRESDDLRITAELIDVHTDLILWKDAIDLKYEKLLTVQDRVAQCIVDGLELKLSPREAVELRSDQLHDPLAYEYYLRGVDLYSRGDYAMAIKMLEKSAALGPKYALTLAQLGRAYNAAASFQLGGREQYEKAQAAYQKALSLQPEQVDTRVYMANMFTDTGRVEEAVPLLRQALRVSPNHAEAHWELGYAYRFGGALEESITEAEEARKLDPSVKLTSSALNGYLYSGQYDSFLDSLPSLDDSALIIFYRGFAEYHLRNWKQAVIHFDHAFEIDSSLLHAQIGKALKHGIKQQRSLGLEILRKAESKINERQVGDPEAIYKVAQAYASLGEKASALRVFRRSVEKGFFPYPYFKSDPLLNDLRNETEFKSIMALAQRRYEGFRKSFF